MLIVPHTAREKNQSILTSELIIKNSKFSKQIPNILANLTKVAIPAIALVAFSSLKTVDGGPVAYAVCVETCFVLAGPFIPACVFGCLPFLAAPTP